MNAIFRQATEDSLVVVDEFGKGSAETDGIGLLVAAMAHLRRLGARSLFSTHFLEIFHDGLIPKEVADQICFRMDVYVPPAPLPAPGPAIAGVWGWWGG
jgi:DNA mismatch repair protein MSH5